MSKQIKHPLTVRMTGYGHWRVTTTYLGRDIRTVTTDSVSVDDWNSDDYGRDGRELRRLRGYRALRAECIRDNGY